MEGQAYLWWTRCLYRRRRWHSIPVLLPGKPHVRRSLVGCSPWGRKESDTPKRLHCHFSLSCIGEGNDTPLQYTCLENPRDGGAWWAAVCGVTQSRTRLKQLSSSSSSKSNNDHPWIGSISPDSFCIHAFQKLPLSFFMLSLSQSLLILRVLETNVR